MSIATKQRQCVERSPKRLQKKVKTTKQRSPSNLSKQPQQQQRQQQLYGIPGKSIIVNDNEQLNEEAIRHETKKAKLLTKQTPVASLDIHGIRDGQRWQHENRQSELKRKEFKRLHMRSLQNHNEILENSADYLIYQNGKINYFFKSEPNDSEPKSVSHVCLVNAHYILVKVPSSEGLKKSSIFYAQDSPRYNRSIYIKDSARYNRKMCNFLTNKRNRIRKIIPINEESEDIEQSDNSVKLNEKSKSSQGLHNKLGWPTTSANNEATIEISKTQTKNFRIPLAEKEKEKENEKEKKIEKEIKAESTKSCEPTPANVEVEKTKQQDLKEKDIQSISGAIYSSSLIDSVQLHQQVAVVEKDTNNLEINYCRKSCSPPRQRKCPRFESFYWLLQPFRCKYRKPKPKIQAVVYKTYFVKWTKPPEILHHGYGGVRSTQFSNIDTSILRRCRSAIF